jgi:hypothetical protein
MRALREHPLSASFVGASCLLSIVLRLVVR